MEFISATRTGKRILLQPAFFQHIEADEAQVADVFLHEIRDVVVAHEQHIERHVLAVHHELVFAARELEPAARQKIERRIGEPARLLDSKLESLIVIHFVPLQSAD